MSSREMTVRRVPAETLHLDPSNARAHGDNNMQAITASLQRFGQAEPLVVQAGTGRVIGGNGRLAAMRALGWAECDIVELDVDDLQATSLGIALNRTAELAEWDDSTLARLLSELRSEDALEGTGFDEDAVDQLLSDLEDQAGGGDLDDPGAQEPPESPVTQVGDLWILGGHRLLCGDSTDPGSFERLMNGEKARLLATDPPYLVDYARGAGADGDVHEWDAFEGDEQGAASFQAFLQAALPHLTESAAIYQWHATRRQALVESAWTVLGLLIHQTVIWAKPHGVLTRSHMLWRHEPCFYGWVQGSQPPKDRRPPPSMTTIWEVQQDDRGSTIHPTQKPLSLFSMPIGWHTRSGEIVLEPFAGSGSQIIAAEEMRRRCFAVEKSPAFVDAIVQRWEGATGKSAALDGDGAPFHEIAERRGDR